MQATAIESRIEAAEALYEKLVFRNGSFIVISNSKLRCRVVMPSGLVKYQKTGFLIEIERLRSDLLKLAIDSKHTPPAWLSDYAFNPENYEISEDQAEEALCAAADNMGAEPEAIENALGEHGYFALTVI